MLLLRPVCLWAQASRVCLSQMQRVHAWCIGASRRARASCAASCSTRRAWRRTLRSTRANWQYVTVRSHDQLLTPWCKQARARELRSELLNSARLAAHFEEHPGDLALLRHDRPLAKAAAPAHLRHLPAYLRAAAAPGGAASSVGNAGRGEGPL